MMIKSYLILFNISKPVNFGNLIRTANAFGAEPIAVGKKDYSRCGATAGTRLTKVHHFYTLPEAIAFTRSQGCTVFGVEISDQSKPIHEHPFAGSSAFMMGNEGEGLSHKQIAMCDQLVYIPQFGKAVSLNVNVAAGIILQHFATWAQFTPAKIVDHKFDVDLSYHGQTQNQTESCEQA